MNKGLLYVIISIIGLFGIYSLLCYFGDNKVEITINDRINAPSLMVYNQVNDFNNWSNWSSWTNIDTSIHTTISDISEGVGATYNWNKKKKGGKISIISSTKASNVNTKLTNNTNDLISYNDWSFEENSKDKTNVEIHFYEEKEVPFFMRGYRFITGASRLIKNGLKYDLGKISDLAERQFKTNIYNGYHIKESNSEEIHFIINRSKVKKDDIQQFYAQSLGNLFKTLQSNNIEMDGMPCGLYFQWNLQNPMIDMASAIPVNSELSFDDVSSYSIPSGEVLVVDYMGDYKEINKAHQAMANYMKDHELFPNPPIIETYITDPSKEKNPENWLTRITYYYSQ